MIDPLEVPIPELADAEIARIARDRYGLTGALHHLGGERDRNVRIDTDRGRFVLKVANRAEGAAVIGLQVAALEHLAQVDPDLPVPRVVRSVDGGPVETVELDGTPHAVRVVTYLDGCAPRPAAHRGARDGHRRDAGADPARPRRLLPSRGGPLAPVGHACRRPPRALGEGDPRPGAPRAGDGDAQALRGARPGARPPPRAGHPRGLPRGQHPGARRRGERDHRLRRPRPCPARPGSRDRGRVRGARRRRPAGRRHGGS